MEALNELVARGANVNPQNRINGATPLHSAVTSAKDQALSRRVDCVEQLLQAGADSTICDFLKRKPLDYVVVAASKATTTNNPDWLRLCNLLESALPNSPLFDCISAMDLKAIQQQLHDNNVSFVNEHNSRNGRTPFYHAALLLFHSIYDNTDNTSNTDNIRTLIDILTTLIEQGADVNLANKTQLNRSNNNGDDDDAEEEATILNEWVRLYCSVPNDEEMAERKTDKKDILQKILLEQTTSFQNVSSPQDSLALYILEQIFIIKGKADPNMPNSNDGSTPLTKVITSAFVSKNTIRELTLASILASHGGKLTSVNNNNTSHVLHDAARRGNMDVMNFLLLQPIDINAPGRQGLSPLHFASRSGKLEAAQALLKAGANPNVMDSMGKTPLDLAIINNKSELIHLFQEYQKLLSLE